MIADGEQWHALLACLTCSSNDEPFPPSISESRTIDFLDTARAKVSLYGGFPPVVDRIAYWSVAHPNDVHPLPAALCKAFLPSTLTISPWNVFSVHARNSGFSDRCFPRAY